MRLAFSTVIASQHYYPCSQTTRLTLTSQVYFYECISDNLSLLLWDCDRVEWRGHSLLELAVGSVVGENCLS